MFRNNLIVALRSMRRGLGTTTIHVAGLGVGLAVAFFIMAWVSEERAYDRFHEELDRIYQVMRVRTETNGTTSTSRSVMVPIAQALEDEYPDVDRTVVTSWKEEFVVTRENETSRLEGYHVGPAFFDIFTFPLILGSASDVLSRPDAVALSASTAARFFGPGWQTDPDLIGSTLRIDDRRDFVLTGIFEDVPNASTLRFDVLLPFDDFAELNSWVHSWGNNGPHIFVRLVRGADRAKLSASIAGLPSRHRDRADTEIFLQPYREVHLWSDFEASTATGGRIEYVRLLSVGALLLLLIACINFTNLATARSARRAREIGIRKSIGSTKGDLVRQFLGESILTAVLAGCLAVVLVVVLAPVSQSLTGKVIGPFTVSARLWIGFAAVTLACGLASGIYPALFLSGMASTDALRNGRGIAPKRTWLRHSLIVVQFAVSIVMLLAAFSIRGQIEYILEMGPGYDRDGLMTVLMEGDAREQSESFVEELTHIPGIVAASPTNHHPLSVNQGTSDPEWPGKDADDNTSFTLLQGGASLAQTLGIPLIAGRYLSPLREEDKTNFLVNETAARMMGLDDPIGVPLSFWGRDGLIVGLVKDFHFKDFYTTIDPLILGYDTRFTDYAVIRVDGSRVGDVVPAVRELYARFSPNFPIEYSFLDESMEETYMSDQQIGYLAVAFTLVSLFISLVGLVGIAVNATQRRAREIGIRKVLGATVAEVIALFSRDLLRPVAVASLIGVPLGYLVVSGWLARYAYHTGPAVVWFVAAPAVMIVTGFLAVWAAAGRAAAANPAITLRAVE